MRVTEARVYVISAIGLLAIAAVCASESQWLGAVGSIYGASQALAARHFLLRWKPSAASE